MLDISYVTNSPYLRRQVATHLVFGPLSRGVPVGWIVLSAALLVLIVHSIVVDKPALPAFLEQLDILIYVAVGAMLLRRQPLEQAVIVWLAVKVGFGMVALGLATFGALLSFLQSKADAWPNLLLGLVWLPGPEFLPAVVVHQKWITVARVVCSIPIVYFGIQSGEWSW